MPRESGRLSQNDDSPKVLPQLTFEQSQEEEPAALPSARPAHLHAKRTGRIR